MSESVASRPRLNIRALIEARPTLGNLLDLCDENYRLLLRIAPTLPQLRGHHLSSVAGQLDLHLEVEAQTPYTSLIRLTYRLPGEGDAVVDPAALLRVYHDARLLELLEFRQSSPQFDFCCNVSTLQHKWRVNLFLAKWLAYSYRLGHRFECQAARLTDWLNKY